MKKSDLISGKHIVALEDGSRLLVAGDFLPDIDGNGYMGLMSYTEDLKHVDGGCGGQFDICKVYEIVRHMGFPQLATKIDKTCKLVWERKPELSEAERIVLENVDKKYKWIVRGEYIEKGSILAELELFEDKPIKKRDYWGGANCASFAFSNLFKMVKWEDEEPTLIADLLGE